MAETNILYEFKQLTLEQQLSTLKAAFEILEAKFQALPQPEKGDMPRHEEELDPLLALGGQFSAAVADVGERHDYYLGEALRDDHA